MSALPAHIVANPRLDRWVEVRDDATIVVHIGKADLGQGISTAIALIVAEELDVAVARVRIAGPDTARSPEEGLTTGSMSIEDCGSAVRIACAEARSVLLARAAARLETAPDDLTVEDGVVRSRASNRSIAYQDLAEAGLFDRPIEGAAPPKSPHRYHTVGRWQGTRLDLAKKIHGEPAFVHDLALPGMLHARSVRSRRGAILDDERADRFAAPGLVRLVRRGGFLAVVCERADQAERAAAALALALDGPDEPAAARTEPDYDAILKPENPVAVVGGTPAPDRPVEPFAPPPGTTRLEATYVKPFHMHGALGPSAAVAHFEDGGLEVWNHTQGVFALRDVLAAALDLVPERIVVHHVEGAGCFGHNGAEDAALDAAIAAMEVPGRPVKLAWSRADEHLREPYGPAMRIVMQAAIDGAGRIAAWSHDVTSFAHIGRGHSEGNIGRLLAARETGAPAARRFAVEGHESSGHRNAEPMYAFPAVRVVTSMRNDSPVRTSSLRSLGAYANVFAIESFMDECAAAAGADPLQFRLAHMEEPRGRAVLQRLAAVARLDAPAAGEHRGKGFAVSRYKNMKAWGGVAVELAVDPETATIRLARAWLVADAGCVVDRDGLANQLEGGFIQAASWTLKEAVSIGPDGPESADWETYPILRFSEVPDIEVTLIDQPEALPLGAGECMAGPAAAAIANAIHDACGLRPRRIPFTPAALRAAAAA